MDDKRYLEGIHSEFWILTPEFFETAFEGRIVMLVDLYDSL